MWLLTETEPDRHTVVVGVAGILFDDEGKVLLGRRADSGKWCLPGGGMEAAETIEETLIREFREETGIKIRTGSLIDIKSKPELIISRGAGIGLRYILLVFEALEEGPKAKPKATGEFEELRYFHNQSLPTNMFEEDYEIIHLAKLKLDL